MQSQEMVFPVQERIDNLFLNNNTYFLVGEIDEESIKKACQWILYEDMKSSTPKDLYLYVNSLGGALYEAMALIDVMRWTKHRITTIGLGQIMSAGFLIFVSGHKGNRFISKNCGIMCHQYSDSFEGKYHDLESYRKETELVINRMSAVLQDATGLDEKNVKKRLLSPSDVWLTAEELVEVGAADFII